jgi:four helix bundle protein
MEVPRGVVHRAGMSNETVRWAGDEPRRLRAYSLALRLEEQVRGILRRARCSRSLIEQSERTAESIVLNIAEGAAHQSPGQKVRHYSIARASVGECIACLDLIRQSDARAFVDPARHNAQLLSRMLAALITTWDSRR